MQWSRIVSPIDVAGLISRDWMSRILILSGAALQLCDPGMLLNAALAAEGSEIFNWVTYDRRKEIADSVDPLGLARRRCTAGLGSLQHLPQLAEIVSETGAGAFESHPGKRDTAPQLQGLAIHNPRP